jgi:excisionase family DNA binding protein
MVTETYLTPHEAAELLHVTVQTIRRYCSKDGKLPYVTTHGGHRRIKKSDLDAFIGAGLAQAQEDIKK